MDYIVAQKSSKLGLVVAGTDEDLFGKVFEEGKLQLDLSKKFYQGDKKTKEEVKKIIVYARHVHLTGKGAVAMGVELDLVNPTKILFIKKVPHAEVMVED